MTACVIIFFFPLSVGFWLSIFLFFLLGIKGNRGIYLSAFPPKNIWRKRETEMRHPLEKKYTGCARLFRFHLRQVFLPYKVFHLGHLPISLTFTLSRPCTLYATRISSTTVCTKKKKEKEKHGIICQIPVVFLFSHRPANSPVPFFYLILIHSEFGPLPCEKLFFFSFF